MKPTYKIFIILDTNQDIDTEELLDHILLKVKGRVSLTKNTFEGEKKEERCTKCNGNNAWELRRIHGDLAICTHCKGSGKEPRKEEMAPELEASIKKLNDEILESRPLLSRYKEALEKLAKLGGGMSDGNRIAQAALSESDEHAINCATNATEAVDEAVSMGCTCKPKLELYAISKDLVNEKINRLQTLKEGQRAAFLSDILSCLVKID